MTPDRPAGEVEEVDDALYCADRAVNVSWKDYEKMTVKAALKILAAEVRRLREENEGRWRPIESAPLEKDVLVWQPGWLSGAEARQRDDGQGWWLAGSAPTDVCGPDRIYPTHWMELPKPPAGQDGTP